MTTLNCDNENLKRKTMTKLSDYGWNVNTYHEEIKNPLTLYCYEPIHTGFTQITMCSDEHIKSMDKAVNEDPMMHIHQVAGAVSSLMRDISNGQNTKDMYDLLGSVALAYAIQTQTFKQLAQLKESPMHFIILNYHNKLTNEGFARPAVVPVDDYVLTPEKLFEATQGIMADDIRRHPEWFPSGEIVPIKPKT